MVVQRVSRASVKIEGAGEKTIGPGLVLLLGVEEADGAEDVEWLVRKLCNLRIFNDKEGVMNHSILDTGGEVLLISQFTLHANTKKGNRPSYNRAAKPGTAIPLYQNFIKVMEKELPGKVKTGEFGADMQVSLVNDGPVTILMDSKSRE